MTGNSSSIPKVAGNRGVSRQHTRAVSLITRSGGRDLNPCYRRERAMIWIGRLGNLLIPSIFCKNVTASPNETDQSASSSRDNRRKNSVHNFSYLLMSNSWCNRNRVKMRTRGKSPAVNPRPRITKYFRSQLRRGMEINGDSASAMVAVGDNDAELTEKTMKDFRSHADQKVDAARVTKMAMITSAAYRKNGK